jgi:ferredoxin
VSLYNVDIGDDNMKDKFESDFIEKIKKSNVKLYQPNQYSVMEGFKFYKTEEYLNKEDAISNRMKPMFATQPNKDIVKLMTKMVKVLPTMMTNINRNFKDVSYLLDENYDPQKMKAKNIDFENFKAHVWENYSLIVGFTELPQNYIFKDKVIPYKYALVFAEEMDKLEIEKAPKLDAGAEVLRVYNTLGVKTNHIARWLRSNYDVECMANHPLGGLVDFVPLAVKAGMGYYGRHGMLISKEFGPRLRISPILVKEELFKDTTTTDHDWIKSFCQKCGKCVRTCPENAIYEEAILVHDENNVIRYESYDREKCFQSFSKAMGCAVCISECPFSHNPDIYGKMIKKYTD